MTQLPLFIPESDWRPPESLPDLRGRHAIAIDTETRDDSLSSNMGPGWATNNGRLLGVSVAADDWSGFIPADFPRLGEWLAELISATPNVIFHNAHYDIGWLTATWPDMECPALPHDTIAQAMMLDENRLQYNLDSLCKWWNVEGKDERKLLEAASAYGVVDAKREMWKLPQQFYAPYAEQDAKSTLALWKVMNRQIKLESLGKAYDLERELIPMVVAMKRRGIRINRAKAEKMRQEYLARRDALLDELSRQVVFGRKLTIEDCLSPISLARMFDNEGLPYPRTPKTRKGSFTKEWLEAQDHWLPKTVVAARRANNFATKFIGTFLLEHLHKGRAHAEIHQYRNDEGGTRSYRFAYANPPLQQIPSRDPQIRDLFEPEDGELWLASDYSQQEPRLTVHYAARLSLMGSEEAVAFYKNDPNADYHQMVADMTGFPRSRAKIINLGIAYGEGKVSLANHMGVGEEEAAAILAEYNERVPFIKRLSEYCQSAADRRGYISLVDGSKCRFDMWEPRYNPKKLSAVPKGTAERYMQQARDNPSHPWHGIRSIKRAGTHKAMNRLIQGGAARQTKMAMRNIWREGITPLLQMHDELDTSVKSEAEGEMIRQIMVEAIPLLVPMKVDNEYGTTWGTAKYSWNDAIAKRRGDDTQ